MLNKNYFKENEQIIRLCNSIGIYTFADLKLFKEKVANIQGKSLVDALNEYYKELEC